jgi:hypothetical protein
MKILQLCFYVFKLVAYMILQIVWHHKYSLSINKNTRNIWEWKGYLLKYDYKPFSNKMLAIILSEQQ